MNPPVEGTSQVGSRGLPRRATYQDVLDAPEHLVAEVIDGELVLSPRPAKRHASVASLLGADLVSAFQRGRTGPGGWVVLDEPEIHFEDDVLVPDLAAWRRERAEPLDDGAYYTVAPDWVCEILSPSTEARDRADKLDIYARANVKNVWLIDPVLETLEAYAWSERGWVTVKTWRGGAKVRAAPFDAIELDLASLWLT